MTVGHKKAASTLIDDCIDKFRQHEVKRKRLLNGRRGSTDGAPVEFTIGGEGDPLSPPLNESVEDQESPEVEDIMAVGGKILFYVHVLREQSLGGGGLFVTSFICVCAGTGLSSSASQSSLRGVFPECILEDSGFEEPQEFRTRCSSLAGGLQRKPGESVILDPTRRRHASAPNHVQPSDADKNRTMLFQVVRTLICAMI